MPHGMIVMAPINWHGVHAIFACNMSRSQKDVCCKGGGEKDYVILLPIIVCLYKEDDLSILCARATTAGAALQLNICPHACFQDF